MIRKTLLLLAVLATTACATSYQPMGDTGGYEQTQLDSNTFAIRFHGNGFTSLEAVDKYAKLRASEIGRQLGFEYVVFLGQEDRSVRNTISTPTTTTTTGTINSYNGSGAYYGTSTTSGGTHSINNPRVQLLARYFDSRPEGRFLEIYKIDDLYTQLSPE